jgi:hypothetical protein
LLEEDELLQAASTANAETERNAAITRRDFMVFTSP